MKCHECNEPAVMAKVKKEYPLMGFRNSGWTHLSNNEVPSTFAIQGWEVDKAYCRTHGHGIGQGKVVTERMEDER